MPDFALTVTSPFADYARGDRITDQAAISEALTAHAAFVVRVATQAAPAPVEPHQEG